LKRYDINIENLVKNYGYSRVIDNLQLTVKGGEFFTIYGPNGAGKTTLLKILSTLTKPNAGKVSVGDYDITKEVYEIRRIIGFVSHNDFLYENLTAYENLEFFSSLYDVQNREKRIKELLEQMDLIKRSDDLVRNFSRGMKKRLTIARSIVHNPGIVLFDEPFSGLDQKAIATFLSIVKDLKSEHRTVIITTHNIGYVLPLSNRIGIMNRGKIMHIEEYSDSFEYNVNDKYEKICGQAI